VNDLHEALDQIREIRAGVARSRVYPGYRAVPTAMTGVLAGVTAWMQPVYDGSYVTLWTGCALLAMSIAGCSMIRHPSRSAREAITRLAWPLLAGALVTAVLFERAPELLPGLWQIFFALGLFASLPVLPRGMILVAMFYLASGALVLGSQSPAAMGIPFVCGQFAAAWLLYRHHG
jgi:hypothetical protein